MKIESLCLGELSTNCYLVELACGLIVIDPAEPSSALLAAIADRPVALVLNTHGHFDHVGGNWVLQRRGARVAIHPSDVPFLDHSYPDHPLVNRHLADGEQVVPGITATATPGHSPGSMVFAAEGVIFCGDLLFAGSIGRTDLPGGSMSAMRTSLQWLLRLPDDTQVYPGHGPPTTIGRERTANPYLQGLDVDHRD